MQLKVFPVIAMFLLTTQAHARTFYQSNFSIDIVYSHMDTGAKTLVSEQSILVRYSDDHEFCEILVDTNKYPCDTFHANRSPESTAITLDRGAAAQLLADVLEGNLPPVQIPPRRCKCKKKCPSHSNPGTDYLEKFQRLSSYLLDPIDLEIGRNFSQQLHDERPESFHVELYNLSEGEKY